MKPLNDAIAAIVAKHSSDFIKPTGDGLSQRPHRSKRAFLKHLDLAQEIPHQLSACSWILPLVPTEFCQLLREDPEVFYRRLMFKILLKFLSFGGGQSFGLRAHHPDQATASPGQMLFINQFAGFGEMMIDELDDVKSIRHNVRIRKPSPDHLAVRSMHIHTDNFDPVSPP